MSASPLPSSVEHYSTTQGTSTLSNGSSILQEQEESIDRVGGCGPAYLGDSWYVREDLDSQVFVDFEVFMKSVLRVPGGWKTRWGPVISAVKADPRFRERHAEHCQNINEPDSLGQGLPFKHLVDAAVALLDVFSQSTSNDTTGDTQYQQYQCSDDPKEQLCGFTDSCAGTPPDPVTPNERPQGGDLPFHVIEVTPHDGVLSDGTNMPRLMVDDIDPLSNHAYPLEPIPEKMKSAPQSTTSESSSEQTSFKPRKRPAEGSQVRCERPTKRPMIKSASGQVVANDDEEGDEYFSATSASVAETRHPINPHIRVYNHLQKNFLKYPLLSHATVCLVDRDRLQFYHANRSVILVSSATNFLEGDGLDKLIAVIIASRRRPSEQNSTSYTTEFVKISGALGGNKISQKGDRLEILGSGLQGEFTITLGDGIFRDQRIVGRSTVVRKGKSDQWPGVNLVVKISWPSRDQSPESEFLDEAIKEAKKTTGEWATKHLPRVFYSGDVIFDEDSTFESVARLFEGAKFANGEYSYTRGVLRIIVQEELYPLKSLTNVRDIGQVFVDIAGIHRWLHDKPRILHGDISLNNSMYRTIKEISTNGEWEQRVYGVLTDYDLSMWTKNLKNDRIGTSQQHTGTPPYMAYELLGGLNDTRLYRHDLESLFYVMLLLCAHHTFNETIDEDTKATRRMLTRRTGVLPYKAWIDRRNQSWSTLGGLKYSFFYFEEPNSIALSPAFEGFRPWLVWGWLCFGEGMSKRFRHNIQQEYGRAPAGEDVPFDDETLGCIDYSSFIEPVRLQLTGELEGLVIRYDPGEPLHPPSSSEIVP